MCVFVCVCVCAREKGFGVTTNRFSTMGIKFNKASNSTHTHTHTHTHTPNSLSLSLSLSLSHTHTHTHTLVDALVAVFRLHFYVCVSFQNCHF